MMAGMTVCISEHCKLDTTVSLLDIWWVSLKAPVWTAEEWAGGLPQRWVVVINGQHVLTIILFVAARAKFEIERTTHSPKPFKFKSFKSKIY